MTWRAHAVYRPAVLYLFMFIILCRTTHKLSKMPSKTIGLGLESFFVGRSRPVTINSLSSRAGKPKSAIVSVPLGLKVHLSLKIFKLFLAAQLVALSGDVMLNPGPLHSDFACPSERLGFCNESFSSLDSESESHVSFASQFNSSMDSLDDSEPYLYFNLDLPSKGLRIGHWNVNHLTLSKFDQVKMFLKNKDGTPQVDVLWLNETFLKPTIPDTLYSVPGFTIFRRDRQIKVVVECWFSLMMNCMQFVEWIWKTQTWRYCGLRLLLLNLKGLFYWLEFIDLHPLPEPMILLLKITSKRPTY